MKHHMKHMIGCGVIIAVALVASVSDATPSWVPGLLVLACPVMMIWMVFAMSGDRDHGDQREPSPTEHQHH